MAAEVRPGLKAGAWCSIWVPTGVAGASVHGPSCATFPGTLAECSIGVGVARTQVFRYGMLVTQAAHKTSPSASSSDIDNLCLLFPVNFIDDFTNNFLFCWFLVVFNFLGGCSEFVSFLLLALGLNWDPRLLILDHFSFLIYVFNVLNYPVSTAFATSPIFW